MYQVLTQYKKQSEAKQLIELKQKAEQNAKIGAAFLAENAKKADVKVTKSGLQYQVLKEGQGKSPKVNSTVKVDYEGRLIDGTVFDSSIARNQPASFQLSQVIQGWTEGLQLMKEGAGEHPLGLASGLSPENVNTFLPYDRNVSLQKGIEFFQGSKYQSI
jgi:FKBP-type peptidyl-prolyl cis-trans isomerase FklB